MQNTELLQEGLSIMGLGMGFVFVFLTVLVISVTLMSKMIGRFQPIPLAVASGSKGTHKPVTDSQEDEVKAVISAAVHRYRSSKHI
ncbi:OadG family protein [Vreelandella zhanjiangensis]|uniref:OadG family protein n=1 Tax=Vreelandella zhanjiangensis TaxID=1121960 RepID=UPI00402AB645